MELDMEMSCVCCDAPVLISSEDVEGMELPIAVCSDCAGIQPVALMAIARLRCQTTSLNKQVEQLFAVQQEIEQEFLTGAEVRT